MSVIRQENADLKNQMTTMQNQLSLLLARGVNPPGFQPPPKHPKGKAKWEVVVSHSQLPPGLKRQIVEADGMDDAWQQFLAVTESALKIDKLTGELAVQMTADLTPVQKGNWLKAQLVEARRWVADARTGKPEIIETRAGACIKVKSMLTQTAEGPKTVNLNGDIVGADYAAARRDSMQVKGTVTRDQIGFAELATAH